MVSGRRDDEKKTGHGRCVGVPGHVHGESIAEVDMGESVRCIGVRKSDERREQHKPRRCVGEKGGVRESGR